LSVEKKHHTNKNALEKLFEKIRERVAHISWGGGEGAGRIEGKAWQKNLYRCMKRSEGDHSLKKEWPNNCLGTVRLVARKGCRFEVERGGKGVDVTK